MSKISNFYNSLVNYGLSGFSNVSSEIFEDRLNICKSCEHFNESLFQCNHCGCFLRIKATWSSEKCPIDKWASEISSENQSVSQPIPASGDCGCKKK